jgi:hypothetical protein
MSFPCFDMLHTMLGCHDSKLLRSWLKRIKHEQAILLSLSFFLFISEMADCVSRHRTPGDGRTPEEVHHQTHHPPWELGLA